jgi:hypothetical protein
MVVSEVLSASLYKQEENEGFVYLSDYPAFDMHKINMPFLCYPKHTITCTDYIFLFVFSILIFFFIEDSQNFGSIMTANHTKSVVDQIP